MSCRPVKQKGYSTHWEFGPHLNHQEKLEIDNWWCHHNDLQLTPRIQGQIYIDDVTYNAYWFRVSNGPHDLAKSNWSQDWMWWTNISSMLPLVIICWLFNITIKEQQSDISSTGSCQPIKELLGDYDINIRT